LYDGAVKCDHAFRLIAVVGTVESRAALAPIISGTPGVRGMCPMR
jgi:hypothetical protein